MMFHHGSVYWRRRGHCKARVNISVSDDFIEQTNEHTHPPCQTNCEVAKVKAGLNVELKVCTNDTSQQILSVELSVISESVGTNLPSMEVLRRNIGAARQERNFPPLPINRAAIPMLPRQYQQTENGQQFLIFDSGVGDAERILIFSSQQGLQLLSNSEHWYGDGTFKVCPEVFFQVYMVHAQQGGRIFPCVFGLLPNKTEGTYTRFFHELFNHRNGNGPNDIFAINALSNLNQQL